ncbi:MAG: prolyl oligopeptidase family serine peptidase [Clostridia bacterium]|nr:prolyl oligopeptidase family serine peptidase [Clostridia bacterium]
MRQKEKTFEKEIVKKINMEYLLYLPKDYQESKKWPLVLFLHGAGERGHDLRLLKRHGIPKLIEEGANFPFIAVSPQCPADFWWNELFEELSLLIDEMKNDYSIDDTRIYLTGLSMGGYGTWDFAIRRPDLFAAIAPVCGGAMSRRMVMKLKNIPVWAFHGAKDNIVLPSETTDLVEVLKKNGGNVKVTIYPDMEHDSHVAAYNDPMLYEWLLEQRKPV